jgi:hypothetical protein
MDALNPRMPRPHGASAIARAVPGPCAALVLARLSLLGLVVLVASPASAADDHPRLGLYGHINGLGAPIVTAGGGLDAALLDRIAARHMVILDASPLTEYHPEVLAALRARRPGIKLVGYVQASYIYYSAQADSGVHIPTRIRRLVRNLNGYLYDLEGEEYDTANINLAKRDAQGRFVVAEAMADFFVDEILATGLWDGMFFDRYCQSLSWMQLPGWTVDHLRAGYPSFAAFDAAWQAGTDTLANRIRRRAGNTPILIGNCGQGNKYAAFNGWMRENFPFQNGGTWQTNLFWPVGGYLTDEPKFRLPSAGWLVAWPSGSVTQPYTIDNLRRARMTLASAALGDGYGTINPSNIDPATGYMNWWYDEYAVNRTTGLSSTLLGDTGWLGRATGPATQMLWIQPGVPDAGSLNPGFESNVTTGWTFTTSIGSTVTRSTVSPADGIASAKITIPAAGNAWSTVFTTVGSVPYTTDTYSAVFWAKASVPRSIWVNPVNLVDTPYPTSLVELGTTWKRYQVLFNGVPGTACLQFRVGTAAGEVWLDDVHFQRGAPSVWRRDFDYGTVLVNPAMTAYDVALGRTMRRITGTRDLAVNNGTASTVQRVNANDALFLLKSVEDLVGVDDLLPGPGASPGAERLAWAAASPVPARAGAETVRLVLAAGHATESADIVVYDARGRRVRGLFAGPLTAGAHTFAWNGCDDGGRAMAPGLYFARARAGEAVAVRKLVLR